MSGSDWIVVAASVAAIVWVNWYFFFAERSSKRSAGRAPGRASS